MLDCEHPFLPVNWANPSGHDREKPRTTGLTMVIDKGLGSTAFRDLLELASPYMDIYKLGFGTTALYPLELLQQKLRLAKQHGLCVMPGGTFFEIAVRRTPIKEYMKQIHALGFNAVEISDGTFPLTSTLRQEAIRIGVETGLVVFSEFGKKAADYRAEREELITTLFSDLESGASHVIVEARESGTVGVFDPDGNIDDHFVLDIVNTVKQQASQLIWEAPRKEQQVSLIHALGSNVNLGNIAYTDVLALETLRRGLRGDTAFIMEEGRSDPCV
ncbi:phosphosulfolactate synthase [Brevibacillus sp. NRS-1366]|uniref:phosphosulfolactate synthase n=1 Tax=Brevibacillus sp. NRS-1366 TaxID=3233899 RepID=UPI003D203BC9